MPSHVLFLVLSITIYIIYSSFINTYLFSKAKKTKQLSSYLAVAFFMSFWSAMRLLEIVSPTEEIRIIYHEIQLACSLLFLASVIGFFTMIALKRQIPKTMVVLLIMGTITISLLVMLIFKLPIQAGTYLLLILFAVINLKVFLYRYKIFPETEISLDNYVNHIDDCVAVFDLSGNLVDMNLRALQEVLIPTGSRTLDSFFEQIKHYATAEILEITDIKSLQNSIEKEVSIETEERPAYYIFRASILKNKKREKLGTVCTLRDITENKLVSMELDRKNKELQGLNEELSNYIEIADSLEEEKERAQIAREINSTVGQKLTEILSVLEVIKLTSKESGDVFERPLNEAIERCHEVLTEIRVVVSRLIPEKKVGGK